ncbi:MAG: S-layer family protein [Lyngbya sp. HA4199-MV5]|nr:S-layer family protein [Lyngbya sp. HA4199-MV5]
MEGGQLLAPGGRVELAGVAPEGRIELIANGSSFGLSVPALVPRTDVSITNDAEVNVRAGGSGSIAINAQNVNISGGTKLQAGIASGNGSVGIKAGDVEINATGAINLINGSLINNEVEVGAVGNAGNVNITTGSLFVSEGSRLSASTRGQGNVGNLMIEAHDQVSFTNGAFALTTVELGAVGNGGDIQIQAGSVAVASSQLKVSTLGQGNSGNLTIDARNTVEFINDAFAFSQVEPAAVGSGGEIRITTGSLSAMNRSFLSASTIGVGNAGSVSLEARDTVFFSNIGAAFTTVEPGAVGNGGNLHIQAGSVSIADGSFLTVATLGQGNAGNVMIEARDSVLFHLGTANTSVGLNDNRIGEGNGGTIRIITGTLQLGNQAQLLANTYVERGNAGNITIEARDTVSLSGESFIFSQVGGIGTVGNGGNINITTGSLLVASGSILSTDTFGVGNGGNITINARDTVSFVTKGGAYSLVQRAVNNDTNIIGEGNGGNIDITTGSLIVANGSFLAASTLGKGDSGNVKITATDAVSLDGVNQNGFPGGIYSEVATGETGNGGNITINARSLTVTNGARLATGTNGRGNAGSVNINTADFVSFDGVGINGVSSGAYSFVELQGVGDANDINITTRSLSVLNNAQLSASTSGDGSAGNITVSADTIGVSSGGQLLTTTFSSGNAGNITVKTPDLQLSGATSGLFAQTTSTGNAGNLTIQPRDNGQSVRVNLQDGAQISASTLSSGRGGELTIAAPELITLTGDGSIIAAGTGGSGAGGNLSLKTGTLNIQNQAEVTVSSLGTGSAGSLFVDANRIFLNNQGSIRADTTGGGGNINLRSPFILLRNGSNITTNATGANIPGGNIAIDTRFLIAVLNEDSNISANSEDFRGGNVRINAFSIFGIRSSLVSTPLSDITATGATSALSGTIDVITAGIDPTAGLLELPTDFADPSGLIAQGCPANQGNSFVITGRGGLPPTPEQQLDDDAGWSDRRRLIVAREGRGQEAEGRRSSRGGRGDTETRRRGASQNSNLPDTPRPTPHTPILEATRWQITPAGEVFLTADAPNLTAQNPLNPPATCQSRR